MVTIKDLKKLSYIEDAKVEVPCFVNLSLKKNFWLNELKKVLEDNNKYGESNIGKSQKVIIEFVSANPTGPLHVGHGRGAIYGNIIAKFLRIQGHDVHTEYYVNDVGRQMTL